MKICLNETRVFIRPGSTDMRKAINGLTCLAEKTMASNPFSGNLFIFCGKSRKLLKALYWDRTGFCLWQKRLEKDRFPWPESEEAARELSEDEFAMLLKGIDFFKAHLPLLFEKTG
jgi:transposase